MQKTLRMAFLCGSWVLTVNIQKDTLKVLKVLQSVDLTGTYRESLISIEGKGTLSRPNWGPFFFSGIKNYVRAIDRIKESPMDFPRYTSD